MTQKIKTEKCTCQNEIGHSPECPLYVENKFWEKKVDQDRGWEKTEIIGYEKGRKETLDVLLERMKDYPERTMNKDNPQYVLGYNMLRHLVIDLIKEYQA